MAAATELHGQYGRYRVYGEFASGGMATVHVGRMLGTRNFALTVAVKRLRPALLADPRFVTMFVDEARLASRIRHPNVVPTLDVVEERGEILIIMEYVQGESLGRLLGATHREGGVPLPIASRILCDVLQGLHAAHEARNEQGKPLSIVHRDVSPQNVLVGEDGIARVVDFGIAKASDHGHATKSGEVKGKLAYLAPEQLDNDGVDRRTDVFATGIMLWEAITGRRLRPETEMPRLVRAILDNHVPVPSSIAPGVPELLDAVVTRSLRREQRERFALASEMADALAQAVPPASHTRVGEWMRELVADRLAERRAYLAEIETTPSVSSREPATAPPIAPPAETAATTEVVTSLEIAPSRGRRLWAWMVPVAILAIAVSYGLGSSRSAAPVSTSSSASASTTPDAPAAPAAATSAYGAQPSSVATAGQPELSPSASASPLPMSHRGTRRATPPPDHAPSATQLTPHAAPDCRIPYVIDRDGVRIARPECM
jgi:eukaryotic-like serine/threonine-protein kinase